MVACLTPCSSCALYCHHQRVAERGSGSGSGSSTRDKKKIAAVMEGVDRGEEVDLEGLREGGGL